MAFKECEEQMTSLGMLSSKESEMNQDVVGKKTTEVMVNESSKSFSPLPVEVQPEHCNGGHGNQSTHGNSEAANSQMDTVVFSFRDYILGNKNNSGKAQMESKTEANQSLEKCSEFEAEMGIDEHQKQSEASKESPTEHIDFETLGEIVGATTETKRSIDFDAEPKEGGARGKTESVVFCKENTKDEFDINVCTDEAKSERLDLAQSGTQQETDKKSKYQLNSKSDTQTSGKTVGPNKEAKKKKHKKKKKIQKGAESEQNAKTELWQSESEMQTLSPLLVCTHTDLAENATSMLRLDTEPLTCREQTDYKQQLTHDEMPKSSPQSGLDHLTATACSPDSTQTLSQKKHESNNHKMDVNVNNQSSQREQHVSDRKSRIYTTPATNIQTLTVNQSDCSEKGSYAQKQEAIVTTETKILTEEDQSVLLNSRTCVGDSCVESGLGKALIVVNTLPLTTPTQSEVIESEGEGESVSCDLQERVATVPLAQCEEEAVDGKLVGRGKYLGSGDVNRGKLLESPCQVLLISSKENSTFLLSAKEGETASEEVCSSKMPHNLAEAEFKGLGEMCIHSTDTKISPAQETDAEKELLCLERWTNTFGPDFQDHSAAHLKRSGEGGGEVREEGGFTGEHYLLSLLKGSAGGVSSVKTGASPLSDVAESQLKSPCRGEPIATIPKGSEEEHFYHKQHDVTVLPLLSYSEKQQSFSITDAGIKTETMEALVSEESLSLGQPCHMSFIKERDGNNILLPFISSQPLKTSQRNEQQARSDQQVGPRSTEERTAVSKAHNQSESCSPSLNGRDVDPCASRGGNRVHFADDVKLGVSSSETLKDMPVSGLDCASLPPLTVHETLHHPVTEASYTFPNVLRFREPENPTDAATIKDGSELLSSNDVQGQLKDVKLGKGDTEKIALDHLDHDNHERNALDLDETAEANRGSKHIVSPTGEGQIVKEDCHIESESKESDDPDHLQKDSVSKQDVPMTVEDKKGNQHNASDDPTYKIIPLHEELLCTDLHPILKSEADPLTSTGANPPAPTSQPSCYLDETPQTKLVFTDVMESIEVHMSPGDFAGLTKEETGFVSNTPFALQPPGPMMSHLEFITDCDVSFPEHTDSHSTDEYCTSVSREVASNEGGEMNQMSLVEDVKQSSASLRTDETCQELKDRACAEHSDDELQISRTKNLSNAFTLVENFTAAPQSSAKDVALSTTKSGNVMPKCQNEPASTVSETSNKDGLLYINCPTSERYVNIEDDSMGEENKLNEVVTMDNQEETADDNIQQTGKTEPTLQQQCNGVDKKAVFMDAAVLQQHKHDEQKTESPPANKEKSNKDFPSKSESKTSSSPSRTTGGFLPPELESNIEIQTVYDLGLSQTVTAALECSSDTNAAPDLSPAFGQSQDLQDLNSFSQEPEQRERCLGSTHSREELSGGAAEAEEKTCSWTQPVVPEEGGNSVQSLFDSERNEEFLHLPAVVRVEMPSAFPVDLNGRESAADANPSADSVMVTVSTQVGEIGQSSDMNKDHGLELDGSDRNKKLHQISNTDQHRRTEILKRCAAIEEFSSCKVETSPVQHSVSSEICTDDHKAHVDSNVSANRAEEVYLNGVSTMHNVVKEAETGVEDFSAVSAKESKQGKIKDAELQSCNKTSDRDSSQVVQILIKGSYVEELPKKDEADLVEEGEQRGVQVADNDDNAGKVLFYLNDKESETESGSGLFNNEVPQSSTETPVCTSEGGVSCAKGAEIEESRIDGTSAEAVIVPSVVTSTTITATNKSEKPHEQVAFSEPQDCTEATPPAAASQCDAETLEKTACSPLVEKDVSENSDPELESQEPDTNWIQALKEAASLSQSEQVSSQDALR